MLNFLAGGYSKVYVLFLRLCLRVFVFVVVGQFRVNLYGSTGAVLKILLARKESKDRWGRFPVA